MGFWKTLTLVLAGWAMVGGPSSSRAHVDARPMCVFRSEVKDKVMKCKSVYASGLDDDHRREDRTHKEDPPTPSEDSETEGRTNTDTAKDSKTPTERHRQRREDSLVVDDESRHDGECGPGGDWRAGKATYYASDEPELGYGTGPMGSRDNALVEGISVASKNPGDFGRGVCIRGLSSADDGVYRVDDECRGKGCKDFDIFVGKSMNGDEGIDDIMYKWLD